jgi:hypothetical protein
VVVRSTAERVAASATQCRALKAALDDEIEVRDGLILQALDEGHAWRDLAQLTGLSQARIQQIVVRRGAA